MFSWRVPGRSLRRARGTPTSACQTDWWRRSWFWSFHDLTQNGTVGGGKGPVHMATEGVAARVWMDSRMPSAESRAQRAERELQLSETRWRWAQAAPVLVPPADESLQEIRQFPNAIRVPGMKHIADNLLHGVVQATCSWDSLLPKLRHCETLLRSPFSRERFLHTCLANNPEGQKRLKAFSVSLRGLRWKAVLNFCAGCLHELTVERNRVLSSIPEAKVAQEPSQAPAA